MELIVSGASVHSSPLSFRERIVHGHADHSAALGALLGLPGVREAVLLSTCNRFEAYLVADDGSAAREAFHRHLHAACGVGGDEIAQFVFGHAAEQAVRHLFRVASSLDSMVVGETQILGQVKQAYAAAVAAKATGPIANVLFQNAVNVAKRVRTETGIARNPVSIPQVAVRFAERMLGDLSGRTVLLVGAGKMGPLTAENLTRRGLKKVVVASRTGDRAAQLAHEIEAQGVSWDKVPEVLADADILLCATNAPQYVLWAADVARVRARSGGRTLLAVDISMPRNLDPEMGRLPGVSLYGIDDLRGEVDRNRADRASEARAAEERIEQELSRFLPGFASRGVTIAVPAVLRPA